MSIKSKTSRLVTIYSIFLFAQLFGLLVSHNILEWKARAQLPQHKRVHVHVILCKGIAAQTQSKAAAVVKILRGNFLSICEERGVAPCTKAQMPNAPLHPNANSRHVTSTMQDQILHQDLQRRVANAWSKQVRESVCVVLFADDTLDFRTGNAASRINYALTQGISVFVIVDGACHSSVQSKLETAFSNGGVPRLLSLHNLGKSYGTVSLVVDGIIRHTDSAIDRTRPHETTHSSEQHAGNGAHPEPLRHLTNAEKRAAEL